MIFDIKVFQAAEIRFGRRGRYLKNENFLGQNSIKVSNPNPLGTF